jgi:hypothetical protein
MAISWANHLIFSVSGSDPRGFSALWPESCHVLMIDAPAGRESRNSLLKDSWDVVFFLSESAFTGIYDASTGIYDDLL